jgi:hypothetical protein
MLPQSSISAELRCPVCKHIYQHPYILACGHSFCYQCIQNCKIIMGSHCPLCHQSYSKNQIMRDQVLISTIEQEQVKCIFPNCAWNGPIKECKLHYSNCPFRKGLSELFTLNYISNKKSATKRKWHISDSSIKKIMDLDDCN